MQAPSVLSSDWPNDAMIGGVLVVLLVSVCTIHYTYPASYKNRLRYTCHKQSEYNIDQANKQKRNTQNHAPTTHNMIKEIQRLDWTTKAAGTHIHISTCTL